MKGKKKHGIPGDVTEAIGPEEIEELKKRGGHHPDDAHPLLGLRRRHTNREKRDEGSTHP